MEFAAATEAILVQHLPQTNPAVAAENAFVVAEHFQLVSKA